MSCENEDSLRQRSKVKHLQARECQRLPANHQKLGVRQGTVSLTAAEELSFLPPHLRLLALKTVRKSFLL